MHQFAITGVVEQGRGALRAGRRAALLPAVAMCWGLLFVAGGCALMDGEPPSQAQGVRDVGAVADAGAGSDAAPASDAGGEVADAQGTDDGGDGGVGGTDADGEDADGEDADGDIVETPAVEPALVFVLGAPDSVPAGETFRVEVQLVDSLSGAPLGISGVVVELFANPYALEQGENALTVVTEASGAGQMEVRLTRAAAGYSLGARIVDVPAPEPGAALDVEELRGLEAIGEPFEVLAGAPLALNSSISGPQGAVADGVDEAPIAVVLADAWNNPVQGVAPRFEASGAGNRFEPCTPGDVMGRSQCALVSSVPGVKRLQLVWPVGIASGLVTFVAPRPAVWMPNGTVYAMAQDESHIYLGGMFTHVGIQSGGLVELDPSTGRPDGFWPLVQGAVHAVVPDGQGGWFIAGNFSRVGDVARQNLARLGADGQVDRRWNPGADGPVHALALGRWLYVGGSFASVAGVTRPRLAALDPLSGRAQAWRPSPNDSVHALLLQGETLLTGGLFTFIGGASRRYLAEVDAYGDATSWDPSPNAMVRSLARDARCLYAGGNFTVVQGSTRPYLAAFRQEGSAQVLTAWNPSPSGPVHALAADDGAVYVGGEFVLMAGVPRARLAALHPCEAPGAATPDADDLLRSDWTPSANGTVLALAEHGNRVYAGGSFTGVDGSARGHLAGLYKPGQSPTGRLLVDLDPGLDGEVLALHADGAGLVAGGAFEMVSRVARNNLAALDRRTGEPVQWAPNPDNAVRSLLLTPDKVYVGGEFGAIGTESQIDGRPRGRLAAFVKGSEEALPWNPDANGTVFALASAEGKLYVGGTFTEIGVTFQVWGRSRLRLAAFDGVDVPEATSWRPAVTHPSASPFVYKLHVHGSQVFAAGLFAMVDAQPRAHLASFDAGSGALSEFSISPNGWTMAMASVGEDLVIGGSFNQIGPDAQGSTVPAAYLARVSPGESLIRASAHEASYPVAVLAKAGATILSGGYLDIVDPSLSYAFLRAHDAVSGQSLPWQPDVNAPIFALIPEGEGAWVGGAFTRFNGMPRQGLVWVPTPWYQELSPETFVQGSPFGELGRSLDESQRTVTLTRGLLFGRTPVTQGQWQSVMGHNPSERAGCEDCPVEKVSWWDALLYTNALSYRDGLPACYSFQQCTGLPGQDFACREVVFAGLDCPGYRLPTEGEWEYAARANSSEARYGALEEIAWWGANAMGATQPVGQRSPNAFALHEMLGNVRQWVWDVYSSGGFGQEVVDPLGGTVPRNAAEASRVVRGCSAYEAVAAQCRVARRASHLSSERQRDIGFRYVRSVVFSEP